MMQQQLTAALLSVLLGLASGFNLSRAYGDNMVLQRAPYRATVWGYGKPGAGVEVVSTAFSETVTTSVQPDGRWFATLPAVAGGSEKQTLSLRSVDATGGGSGKDTVVVEVANVLFGDVWVCSGQSNMQMTVASAFNATAEAQAADRYGLVRVFTASRVIADHPLEDFEKLDQGWAVASAASIGGPAWMYFSATCWFFGRDLSDSLPGTPIGLIATSWGGTYVQAWSSPDALAKCNSSSSSSATADEAVVSAAEKAAWGGAQPNPNQPSVLWNAMIAPLLHTTIRGAVWYQGEANCGGGAANYACQFPAMIQDWRAKWHQANPATDREFPFGFAQLSVWNDNSTASAPGPVPVVRWGQTANHGSVPNPDQPGTFMAVTVDLGDPSSPLGDVHPRDKQAVGSRLARGALSQVYNHSVGWTGPIATSAAIASPTGEVSVTFVNVGQGLVARFTDGFEVCGGPSGANCTALNQGQWFPAPLLRVTQTTAILQPAQPNGGSGSSGPWRAVRYLWRQAPCSPELGEGRCALYCSCQLPAPPFFLLINQ